MPPEDTGLGPDVHDPLVDAIKMQAAPKLGKEAGRMSGLGGESSAMKCAGRLWGGAGGG